MSKVFSEDPPVRAKPKNKPAPAVSSNSSGKSYEDPGAVIKRNAIQAVTEKLKRELKATYDRMASEIDTLMSAGSTDPRTRKQQQLNKLKKEIEESSTKYDELTRWLAANDKGGAVDIDAITEPRDVLSKQLLHLVAGDAALEDCLYYMEKALLSGSLSKDDFLKTYRQLAREQFMKRATMKKVHEVQRAMKSSIEP
eukprot:CAMPEP_0168593322 /NCGR_PEP_ID=MMETSP0420-20121227/8249_1 /TAXON_ID=498008 /ORGANISM="Pessonella sp." /LENGTH=196 /DNA_ID=CAMNT_0008629459 /DNA_START=431 /DNA_END=1017 /DNA_ORIENTATION=-